LAYDSSLFNSGETTLDDWLRRRAWNNMQTAASRTYVVCPTGTMRIVGYFALSMGQILARDVTGSMRRKMPASIPAVLLGRLAVDMARQRQGLGRAMLADIIRRSLRASAEVSARLVIVHAISSDAEAFYLYHGFTRLPVEAPSFALDLVKFDKTRNKAKP
jgi:predicted N-acetyltransferase YhbS